MSSATFCAILRRPPPPAAPEPAPLEISVQLLGAGRIDYVGLGHHDHVALATSERVGSQPTLPSRIGTRV